MKRWMYAIFYTVLAIVATGCAQQGMQLPIGQKKEYKVRDDLPKVETLRAIGAIASVGLEWKMAPSAQVEGYTIYRKKAGERRLRRIQKIDDRYSTHFVDSHLRPNTEYVYQIATYDKNGYESRQSYPARIKTAPMIQPVSFVRAITNLPHRIKLIWRPHQDPRVVGYVIERAKVTSPDSWKELKEVSNRLSAEYIDKDLGDGEIYLYRIRVRLCNGLVSAPTQPVKAIAKPLPLPPLDLQTSNNRPRMIHLQWQPSPTKDVVYYKVYRSPFSVGFYRYRAKTDRLSFEDRIKEDGKIYYYKVTSVDEDGLESEMPLSPVVGMSLPKPQAPLIFSAKIANNRAIIVWRPADKRAAYYKVERSYWKGLTKQKRVFNHITSQSFEDPTILPGIRYTYRIYAVDQYDIASNPSESVELILPKPER